MILLLGFLGFIVLLVFCVVDLYHLKAMLKTMQKMEYYLSNIEDMQRRIYIGEK